MLSSAEEDLLKKLESGHCTEEELESIFTLATRVPEGRAHKVMEQLWKRSSFRESLPESVFANIARRIGVSPSRAKPAHPLRRYRPWLAAAAILLLLVAGVLAYLDAPDAQTTKTAFAEQKTIVLPDGSTVWLNANSSLTYLSNWSDTEDRRVTLEGEAFFRVNPQPATGQKFLVITPDLTVAVYGTVFNVNSRAEATSVFLEEGQISLQLTEAEEAEEKIMVPGELITYSAKQKKLIEDVKPSTPEVHTSWKDGALVFDNTPLAEVLEKVENIYGVTFEVADSNIYRREITAGLPMEKLTIVVPLLEQVLGYSIVETDGRYRITE